MTSVAIFAQAKELQAIVLERQQQTPMPDVRRRLRKKQSPGPVCICHVTNLLESISACESLLVTLVALGPSSAHCLRATSTFLKRQVHHLLPNLPWKWVVVSVHPTINYMHPVHCINPNASPEDLQYRQMWETRPSLPDEIHAGVLPQSWRVSISRDVPGSAMAGCRYLLRGRDVGFYEAAVFDIDSESWRVLPVMPHARPGATAVAILL